MQTEQLIAKGLCERIGIEGSQITYDPTGGEKAKTVTPMKEYTAAIGLVIDALTNEKTGVVKELRRRQCFDKPSIVKRDEMMHAIYIEKKNLREE